MYKKHRSKQQSLTDFNQPFGLTLNSENRWVKLAELVPWTEFEDKYAMHFVKPRGGVAKPFRMALGALIIQSKTGLSDRELVQQIEENPYYQYFIGLNSFQNECPFTYSALPHFRMRITAEMIGEINEYIISKSKKKQNDDNDNQPPKNQPPTETDIADKKDEIKVESNNGTVAIDATCAPSNIRYPMDASLLNEAREKLEVIVKLLCKENGEKTPRMYLAEAHRVYLNLAKSKKPTKKKVRNTVKKMLSYVRRDIGYVDVLLAKGYELKDKSRCLLETIKKLYEQQKYMCDKNIHSVANRIVSISQPFIRPIVRGKTNAPVEFGAKIDISIDTEGYQRLEKLSFEAYNEQETLVQIVENFKKREGHYPERVLADKIYNNRNNRQYCKERGIRLSGPKLGRRKKDDSEDRKIEYQDMVDRIGVERAFSLDKRCFGMGLVKAKLEGTIQTVIALSVLSANLSKALGGIFLQFFTSLLQKITEFKFSEKRQTFLHWKMCF